MLCSASTLLRRERHRCVLVVRAVRLRLTAPLHVSQGAGSGLHDDRHRSFHFCLGIPVTDDATLARCWWARYADPHYPGSP